MGMGDDDSVELSLDDWKAALKAACRDADFWEERARGWQTRWLNEQQEHRALQASWEQKVQELHAAQARIAELEGRKVDDLTERREARGATARTPKEDS